MIENRALFLLSSAFLGIGLACIHVFHVSNVFEFQTGFSDLPKVEKELILAQNNQFYRAYKVIVDHKNFDIGFNRVIFDNITEWPAVINDIHRFHVVPEIFAGMMYLAFVNISETYNLPFSLCEENEDSSGFEISCNSLGDSVYFYLNTLWILSGLGVFILFMYGTFLSKNVLGGFSSTIYYFTLHENASSLQQTPTARENFALPFMLIQFFILSKEIAKHRQRGKDERNFSVIWDLCLITTVTVIFWQISSVIFALQLLVIFFLYETNHIKQSLAFDYVLSQIFANVFAYVLTNKNNYFLTSSHFVVSLSFMLHATKGSSVSTQFRMRNLMRNTGLLLFFIYITVDVLNKIFSHGKLEHNANWSILNLIALRVGIIKQTSSLIVALMDSMSEYKSLQWETAKGIFNVFCLKNICLFFILFLAKLLHHHRNQKNKEEEEDMMERAKNYVIEDYMEEHSIKMKDLTNSHTESEIQKCLELLKDCKYDYKRYKEQKTKNHFASEIEKLSFLSDIKKLKNQINERERNEQKKSEKKFLSAKHQRNVEKQDLETSKEGSAPAKENEAADPMYLFNFVQLVALGVLQLFLERMKFVFIPYACVFAATVPSRKWFSRNNTHIYWALYFTLMVCTLINPGVENIRNQYKFKETKMRKRLEELQILKWIETSTPPDSIFGGPPDLMGAVQVTAKRTIINHAHIEVPEIGDVTKSVLSIYSRRPSIEVHNELAALKLNYLIVSFDLCYTSTENSRALIRFWDTIEPEYKNDSQLCDELFQNSFTSFLKVFESKKYIVLKVFSENIHDFPQFSLLPSRYKSK